MKKQMPFYWMGIIIAAVLALDHVVKYIIKTSMSPGQSFPVLGNFFHITYVENPGMAFGIRFDNTAVFLGFSLIAVALVFYYLYRMRNENWLLQLALSLITAGAIGNLADRILRGKVVDLFDFEFFDISIPSFHFLGLHFQGYYMTRWPVFNIADMAVSIGMIILIGYILIVGDPLKPSLKTPADSANG